jgi:hypothetical protein
VVLRDKQTAASMCVRINHHQKNAKSLPAMGCGVNAAIGEPVTASPVTGNYEDGTGVLLNQARRDGVVCTLIVSEIL